MNTEVMSPAAGRFVMTVVFVVMLALSVAGLVLASLGRETWLLVGGAMTVATEALVKISSASRTGERAAVTPRGQTLILGLAVVAAVSLLVGGVTSRSAFTWLIAAMFLTGLVTTTWGAVSLSRKAAQREAA